MNDLVSIVMPVYNAEKYLEEAISSCLEQTYSNIEIIAINDGSSDNSLEILKNYEDKIFVKSQRNKGVSAATNYGIRSMNGKLFKIMNADDILYPECVELLVSEFLNVNDKKTIIHADCDRIDSEGKILSEYHHPNYNNLSHVDQNVILLDHDIVTNITSLFHVNAFSQCGYYDESLRAAVDYELWLRLCLQFNYKLHLLEKKLVKMRVPGEGGITFHASKETPNYADEVRKLILSRLDLPTRKKYNNALKEYKKKNQLPFSKKNKKYN